MLFYFQMLMSPLIAFLSKYSAHFLLLMEHNDIIFTSKLDVTYSSLHVLICRSRYLLFIVVDKYNLFLNVCIRVMILGKLQTFTMREIKLAHISKTQ